MHELDGPEAASPSVEIANNVVGRLFRHTHCLLEVAANGNALSRQKLMHPYCLIYLPVSGLRIPEFPSSCNNLRRASICKGMQRIRNCYETIALIKISECYEETELSGCDDFTLKALFSCFRVDSSKRNFLKTMMSQYQKRYV